MWTYACRQMDSTVHAPARVRPHGSAGSPVRRIRLCPMHKNAEHIADDVTSHQRKSSHPDVLPAYAGDGWSIGWSAISRPTSSDAVVRDPVQCHPRRSCDGADGPGDDEDEVDESSGGAKAARRGGVTRERSGMTLMSSLVHGGGPYPLGAWSKRCSGPHGKSRWDTQRW